MRAETQHGTNLKACETPIYLVKPRSLVMMVSNSIAHFFVAGAAKNFH